MIKRQLGALFLVACLSLITAPAVMGDGNKQVINVAGDGSGTYNCDGKDDQIEINQALEYAAKYPGSTVYLKGPFTYMISGTCLIGSNTELTGDSTAKLKLVSQVGWTTAGAGTPIIGQIGGKGTVVHDIKIHGFEIDGNEGAQSGSGGKDLYRLISFQGSSSASVYNIFVYNMNLHDAKGEGFRVTNGKNIYYYGNIGSNLQHCCVMYSRVKCGEIHDNTAYHCACAGNRLDNCQDIIIANEKISPYSGATTYVKDSKGYAVSDNGIQISDSSSSQASSNIVIRNCNIMSGVDGIQLDGLSDGSNVTVYNNVIHDSGYENEGVSRNGGIGITNCGNGITIMNNDITGSYVAGVNANCAVSSTQMTIANNNIMNGKTGYAVKNCDISKINLFLTHNYISGNPVNFYPSSLTDTSPATSPNSKNSSGDISVLPQPSNLIPVAAFSTSPTSGIVPLKVQFTDKSTNSPTAWKWNFADGNTSTEQNPVYVFTKPGIFTVSLTASNKNGSSSISTQITVTAKSVIPVAAFSASSTTGVAPLSVTFTDKSTGSPTSWSWNFADGNTSTQKNPVHQFTKAGTYNVSLTASNKNGSSSSSVQITITAKSVVPVAAFSASFTTGVAPLSVTFTDKSTGSPTSWSWNFGDGNTSTQKNPVHQFTKAGTYTVSLTASNKNGSSSSSVQITVTAKSVVPVAAFSASSTTGIAPLNVTFTDKSTGSPTSWSWNFGDGTTSTQKNPVHQFTKAGTYNVSLTASNKNGSSSSSVQITVTAKSVVPVAAFSASSTIGIAPLSVTFTDKSTGSPTSWSWNFGDGNTSTQKNPVHQFTKAGTYTVSLTASNKNGSSSSSVQITVTAKSAVPVAAFSASPTSGAVSLKVQFTDKSTNYPTAWKWNFGDGTAISTAQNPTHTYSKAGRYTVVLTASNAAGSNTITKSNCITVAVKPVAAFSASPTSGKATLQVQFTDKSTNSPSSWSWNFGDKSTSTAKNPTHKYTKAGKYTVTLTVKNAAGSSIATKTNYITVS